MKHFKDLKIGSRGSYIHEEGFRDFSVTPLCTIPAIAAQSWFEEINQPPHPMRCNKEWMVVQENWDNFTAIYNHDGTYYLYRLSEIKF